ncbi:MAG: nuclear transport factor 2 family protein [Actinobacteria bacterium]|nr:nuclear transport factor 2 family protein [Actinomycetota bacterium]
MAEQKTGFDFEALRRAEEQHDLDSMLDLYADDAELRIVNRSTPPSSPFELHGKEEIAEFLRDVFSREMTHQVENEVVGEDRIAFNVSCQYPDGTRVLASENLEVRDGKIARQVEVVAWDE